MKFKIKLMVFVLALLVANISNSIAQVTLIDPNGDGGFESGSTFASNGWTVAAGTANNQWFVGSGAVPHTGSNCAYVSETGNGSTYTYNFTSASTVYFYRDITFPAGNPRIVLKLNYNVGGEPFFDRGFVCYTDPANTPVVNDFMSSTPPSYATAVTGNFNSWSSTTGWSSTVTYLLPASFAGTTKRLIFAWQNDGNAVGVNGPMAFDNVSLVASPSIVCTPTANGGLWSSPATWTNGDYPGSADDVLIPDGVTLTLDAVQSIRNLTIGQGASGVLNFTTAFNALTVSGNITVNNGGRFNGFTQTQSPTAGGVTVNVAGNINLNAGGTMTMGHSSALLHLNGTTSQSINGPGVFLEGLVRELRISNNSSVAINTPVKVTQTFGHFGGTLNTNGNLTLDCNAQSFGNAYNQQIYAVSVTNMGAGYTSQPLVTIAPPSGAGTQATAVANWDAVTQTVRSITITNPGSGYRANPTVTFSGATFTTAAVAFPIVVQAIAGNATGVTTFKNGGTTINGGLTINNSQSVGGISMANTASNNIGYVTAPTVGFSLPVRTFLCPNPGSGYTSATVTISAPTPGPGNLATATAVVANGKITSITITNGGSNYTSPPTITINGVGGAGVVAPTITIPAATAIISNGMVSGFNITNGGSDYTAAPTITLTGGTPSAAAAAPTCRIGLYNINYSTTGAPTGFTTNVAVTEGPEIPANRKINVLTLNNSKHLTLNDNLELTAASGAISLTGLVYFSGPNNTITCSNPGYGGTAGLSALNFGYVIGKVTLTCPGGNVTRTFPIDRHGFAVLTGAGSGGAGVGCDITSLTAEAAGMPSGTFTSGSFTFPGTRSFKLVSNTPSSQYGSLPQVQINYTVAENLISDNPGLFVAQASASTGTWTVRSVSSGTGPIVATGNRLTAVVAPGPVVLSGTDYFTFATTYTPPASLTNFRITRTTGNTFNSIAGTGNTFTWAGSSPTSTETNRSNPVLLPGTTFQYQGSTVTGFAVGLDGYFTFNTAFASNLNSPLLGQQSGGFANIDRALAPFWANMSCASLSQIKYQVDGTLGSGSAVITIQWSNMTGSGNPTANSNSDLTFQIKLFESDNHIEYNYGLMKAFDGSNQAPWSYACGMNGSFVTLYPTPGQVLALQERYENTTNFSNEGVVSQSRGANNLHTLPECYSSYKFELLSPIAFVPGSGIPANDDAANAVLLTETITPPTDYCSATFTSFGATASAPANACAGSSASKDVWFKFVATDPATAIKVVSSGGYDAVVQVFDASFNSLSTCVNSTADGRAEVATVSGLTLGNMYYVRVFHNIVGTQATATATVTNGVISSVTVTSPGSGYGLVNVPVSGNVTPRVTVSGGGGSNAVLNAIPVAGSTYAVPGGIADVTISSPGVNYTSAPTITIDPPSAGLTGDFAIAVYSNSPPPANNAICSAISLTVNSGSCSPTAGTTLGATATGGIPNCTGTPDDDVFYSFVATNLTTSVQVFSSAGFDAVIQVLSSSDNTCNGILTNLACVNNNTAGGTEVATFVPNVLFPGNTYFVRVFHASAGVGSGDFSICVFESGPPCPTVTSPLGSLANVNGTNLVWNAVFGATGYDVYFSTNQSDVIFGAPAALVSSNQPGLSYTTPALTNGTVYYWRIDGRNAQGASAGCNVHSFTGTTDLIIGGDASGICSGNFYDSGGLLNGYQSGESSVSTICPTLGASTKITFSSFSTSAIIGGEDVLYVYNGPSTASPLFPGGGSATGSGFPAGGFYGFSAIPNGTSFTSTDASGCITLKFSSDAGSSVAAGWAATVSCEYLCTPLPTYPSNNGVSCLNSSTPLTWPLNPVATGYDVYFGNTFPPTTLVSANQSGNTYNPGPLAVGTYYWKVITIYPGNIPCPNPVNWSFNVVDLPSPSASSNSPVCEGTALSLFGSNTDPSQTTGNTYLWTGPNGFNDLFQNPLIPNTTPLASGTYTLTVTNANGCTASTTTLATIVPLPALNILSQTNVGCIGGSDGAFTIEVTNGPGTFLFDENGNVNFDGVFTNYSAGSYTVQVTDGNSCSSSIGVTIGTTSTAPPANSCTITPATIPTNATACVGGTYVVSTNVVSLATGYTWSVPTGTLINGQPGPVTTVSNTVTLTLGPIPANASGWEICAFAANGCGQTNTNCKYIRGSLSIPAAITGSTVACPSTNGVYSTLPVVGATSYLWTGTNGITFTGSGTSVTANFPAGFSSGTICVAGQLPCGYNGPTRCITVTNGTPLLGAMSGNFTVCPGTNNVSYSVPPSAGANIYNWTLPAFATIASGAGTNSILVNFAAGFAGGNICVTAQSICGINSLPRCKTVVSNKPGTPGNISGAATGICGQNISYSVPSVAGATSYTWTAPGGASLNSPNGSNSIDVLYPSNYTNGNLCVTANNGCGSSTPRCIPVKGTPANPAVINGPAVVCANESGDTYSTPSVFGATSYTWVVPAGAVIQSGQGTSSILLDWGTNGGLISVTAIGPCGSSGTKTLNISMSCKVSGSSLPGTEVNAYPNPVSTKLTVELNATMNGDYTLELMDLSGRVVLSQVMNAMTGLNRNSMDVSNLSKGMYMLSVKNASGYAKQIRIAVE